MKNLTKNQEDKLREFYVVRLVEKGISQNEAMRLAEKISVENLLDIKKDELTAPAKATGVVDQGNLFDDPRQVKPRVSVKKEVQILSSDGIRVKKQYEKDGSQIILAGSEIAQFAPASDDISFTHTVLCQVGLPRKHVEGQNFLRQSGDAWLSISSGFLDEGHGPVMQPIPYGAFPRLALAWVSTFAKKNSTREVPIGDSAAQFLTSLGLGVSGGKRGSYATLKKQMHALAACRLQLGYKGRTYNGQPVERFDAWLRDEHKSDNDNQISLWPGVMLLSQQYFDELDQNGVPLDNRALLVLKGSSLSLDVYTWLAHRLHRIGSRPLLLYWKSLQAQFGQEYTSLTANKDFKRKFLVALKDAMAVYPAAKIKQVTGGLMLYASPPPVPFKQKSVR